jgi:release factor glutamine methyltransferase
MQLKDTLRSAVAMLEENLVGSPRMNAEVLLMFVLGCDRAYLYAHPERELSEKEAESFDEALATRSRGVPAQYIVGHQEFWGLDFIVGPAVLIPRPETEHLVEAVLELCGENPHPIAPRSGAIRVGHSRAEVGQPTDPSTRVSHLIRPRIVDVGTGSGCVALALASELAHAEIHATEISEEALEIARANAARLGLHERVKFHCADLLQGMEGEFDIVASNPPYVGESEYDKVQLEVRKFEPRDAVFAGAEGMDVIRRLAPQARASLKSGGWLAMEIGFSQETVVREVLRDWREVRTVPDLQGIPRVVLARK